MKLIAIDVDGTLLNQVDYILDIANLKYNLNLRYEDVTEFDLKIADTDIYKLIVERQLSDDSYLLNMKLFANADKVIQRLHQKYQIAIATARAIQCNTTTKQCLANNNIEYDVYYNAKEKSKESSADFDLLIDDYNGNLKSFLSKTNKKAVLMNQPWNQERADLQQYIDTKRLFIANNWLEVEEIINKIL